VRARFGPDDDQQALVVAIRDVLADVCPRDTRVGDADASAARWAALAKLGLLGLGAPEAAGGLAADETWLVLALEECGRAALPEPVAGTAVVGVPLLADLGDPTGVLPELVAGRQRLAVRLPGMRLVPGAVAADLLLLADDEGGFVDLVSAAEAVVRPAESADRTLGLATAEHCPPADTRLADGPPAVRALGRAGERAALGGAAELVGLATGMVGLAVDYAKTRTQFGRPIGANQAVKHLLADAHLAVTFARPLVHHAAWALASGQPTAARDVSAAAFAAARAAQTAARATLQVHGAIGYTREHPLHRWLIRVWSLIPVHRTPEQYRARVLAALRDGQVERVP
jgi:alkylation response protein AidB-like acyl-CoA dehydrogenase